MEKRGDYQKRWRQILLIRPYYRADGRTASKILYLDGSSDDLYCRCEQVVAELAQFFYTMISLAQKRASKLLGESKEHFDIPQRRATVTKQLKRARLLHYNFQQEQRSLEQEEVKKSTKKQKKCDDIQQKPW